MRTLLAALGCLCLPLHAQVPNLLNDQGRVAVDGLNFDGQGQFKFALVNADDTVICRRNDGATMPGSEPAASVAINATGHERQIVLAIQEMQAAARQKYARRDPVQLQNYFFGERINPNEATLHQIAFTIAERLTPHTGTEPLNATARIAFNLPRSQPYAG